MLRSELYGLLAGTSDAALVITPEGKICDCNEASCRLFGLPATEISSRGCAQLLEGKTASGHPICSPACPVLEQAKEGRLTDAFDVEIQAPAGRRWVNVTTLLVPTKGHNRLIVHLLRDVEVAKRLELLMRHILDEISTLTGAEVPILPASASPHLELSPREHSILRMLTLGLSSKEIAEELGCSVATVRNHTQHLLHKLSVHSRTAAALRAVRERLA
jgi:PAS domain S-box-containing protein